MAVMPSFTHFSDYCYDQPGEEVLGKVIEFGSQQPDKGRISAQLSGVQTEFDFWIGQRLEPVFNEKTNAIDYILSEIDDGRLPKLGDNVLCLVSFETSGPPHVRRWSFPEDIDKVVTESDLLLI